MRAQPWPPTDLDPEEVVPSQRPALVSLHFLRGALRRRWWLWLAVAGCFTVVGGVYGFVLPLPSTGTVTMSLARTPGEDPAAAMATDVALMETRTVAAELARQQHLDATPEDVRASIRLSPLTSSVLVAEVSAPDDETAVARAKALATIYLNFRAQQATARADALLAGYQDQEASLQGRVDALTKQYDAFSKEPGGAQQASSVLTQRAQLVSQIDGVQQEMDETTLESHATIAASRVIDPASAVPHSPLKRGVLATATGSIGGLAAGVALVIIPALLSTRLRRRGDVALAVGAPVRFSVGKPGRMLSWLLPSRRKAAQDRDAMVKGLHASLFPLGNRHARLVVAAVGRTDGSAVVVSLAKNLAEAGRTPLVVDLTRRGRIASKVAREWRGGGPDSPEKPPVLRPPTLPTAARGPLDEAGPDAFADPSDRETWEKADAVLTLAEVGPSANADHLRSWAERGVLLVTAGQSSAQGLETTADVLRAAGISLPFVVLLAADPQDESSGLLGTPENAAPRLAPAEGAG